MWRKIFDPDSYFWRPLGYVGELVMLSLLWVVCCLPVVTAGQATAALYDCVVHCVRRGEGDLFGRFFRTFRREWKLGILSTLLWGGLLGLTLWLSSRSLAMNGDGQSLDLFGLAFQILLLVPIGCACWVFPLLSRFENSFASLNRSAVLLALGQMPRSIVMALVVLFAARLFLYRFTTVFFSPGIATLLCSFLLEPVFQRYSPIAEDEKQPSEGE